MTEITLGQRIKCLRALHRLSMDELASRAGLSRRTVQNVEGDDESIEHRDVTIEKIAEALGLTTVDLTDRSLAHAIRKTREA